MTAGRRYIYRCSEGHLFSHSYWWWWYGGALTRGISFGGAIIHCPVGNHWGTVRRESAKELTQQERQTLALRERLDDQDSVRLNGSRGLIIGVIGLVFAMVVQSWWVAVVAALWVVVFAAIFIHGRRDAGDGS